MLRRSYHLVPEGCAIMPQETHSGYYMTVTVKLMLSTSSHLLRMHATLGTCAVLRGGVPFPLDVEHKLSLLTYACYTEDLVLCYVAVSHSLWMLSTSPHFSRMHTLGTLICVT
jgi:hypothetical protein